MAKPLTEMSTRNLPGNKRRSARKANNLTAICEPMGLHGLLEGLLYLLTPV
jgi:hypothetical protein